MNDILEKRKARTVHAINMQNMKNIRNIFQAVKAVMDVSVRQIKSDKRFRIELPISDARHIFIYMCVNRTTYTRRMIALQINKNHAVTYHAMRKVNNLMDTDIQFKHWVTDINAILDEVHTFKPKL